MGRPSLRDRLAARRAAEAGLPPAAEGSWFALHTYSGYENKVKKTIESRVDALDLADRVFEILVPTQKEKEKDREGKLKEVDRKVFPGYVLVRMLMDDDAWYTLRNTPGVTGFVSINNRPIALGSEEVQNIITGLTAQPPKLKATFSVGDTVQITDGPFADFRGEVNEVNDEKEKVRVLVSFFGRDVPVELDFFQVETES